MRSVSVTCLLLLAVSACGTTQVEDSPFLQPNQLMGQEIRDRIEQIPYQHREELFNNLLWLSQTGEQAIPALLKGLHHTEPKVRANCAWVLGQMHDRRVIPDLQAMTDDPNETVRLEVARTLVSLGDLNQAPTLIEGLDSDKVQVRYLCHEALKDATRRDFDYDHLADDEVSRAQAVYRWRTWWAKQSGDTFFASSYAQQHGLRPDGQPMTSDTGTPAAPSVETAPRMQPKAQPMAQEPVAPESTPANEPQTGTTPETGTTPQPDTTPETDTTPVTGTTPEAGTTPQAEPMHEPPVDQPARIPSLQPATPTNGNPKR